MRSSLRSVLSRFPRLKRLLKFWVQRSPVGAGVSSHYVQIQGQEAEQESIRLRGAWQSEDLPTRQRELVDTQLAAFRRGEPVDVFDVMTRALRALPSDVRYAGCDYSDAFIGLARQTYPMLRFDVEDATALKYGDNAFDIVISGCCLLHIPEYEAAVAETARVARRYAIFHRTPMVLGQPNVYYRK